MLALRYLAFVSAPGHRFCFTVTIGWISQILSETIDLKMKRISKKMKRKK
jgi:hypothetical protein